MVAISHMCLLNTQNVNGVTEELNPKFYLFLINLNLNSILGLVANIVDSSA